MSKTCTAEVKTPCNKYKRGRSFEYAVKARLAALGLKVFRCAGSKPVDLIAVSNLRAFAVECKGAAYVNEWKERNALLELTTDTILSPILITRKNLEQEIGLLDAILTRDEVMEVP